MDTKQINFQSSENIIKIVQDHFSEDPEVLDIAYYILGVLNINEAIIKSVMAKKQFVENVPPQSIGTMMQYDNSLVANSQWDKLRVPIKVYLTIDSIKLETMAKYIEFGEQNQSPAHFVAASVVLMSRFDVLTTLATFWKDAVYGAEFDAKLRVFSSVMDREHQKYFKARGV